MFEIHGVITDLNSNCCKSFIARHLKFCNEIPGRARSGCCKLIENNEQVFYTIFLYTSQINLDEFYLLQN